MFRAGSALLLLLLAPAVAFAQGGPQVIRDNQHDVSPPLRDLPPAARHVGELEAEPVRVIPSGAVHEGRISPSKGRARRQRTLPRHRTATSTAWARGLRGSLFGTRPQTTTARWERVNS